MPGSDNNAQAALTSLDEMAMAARSGFACLFSTADEYEQAVIMRREADGHYRRAFRPWPVILFIGCVMVMAGTALLLS
jgi:hypothetical protein